MKKMFFIFVLLTLATAANGQAKMVARVIPYMHGDTQLQGYLVYDDSFGQPQPGIMVVHEWWGLNDYAKKRAEQLASLGYVAFAADMYGRGKVTSHPNQASEWMSQITKNVGFWKDRALTGLEILKKNERVDPSRLGAIGYCFGGSTVQQLAYSGADLKAIVSFHGGLINPPAKASDLVKASFLICHGADDPFVTEQDLQKYLSLMKATSLDWEMIIYGGAKHSFTNPDADKAGMEALKYNPVADRRSWAQMKLFFNEFFSSPKRK